MIEIRGSAQRVFHFPAARPLAYEFYSDFNRIVPFLPHISLIDSYGSHSHRLRYHATELGAYRVYIYADVHTMLDPDHQSLVVIPRENGQPVKDEAGFTSVTTQGFYTSQSIFSDNETGTEIEYSLQLRAQFPAPIGLRLMPGGLMNHIANSITNGRIQEIIDAFIKHSIAAYPSWLAQKERDRGI
jgi:hypothetical protein